MHFVDNIHFIFSFSRCIFHFFTDLPDIFHSVIRCRIDLYDIHGIACRDGTAGFTGSTRTSIYRMFAVHCFCKNLGCRRLTGSPRSAKEICMSDPVRFYLIFNVVTMCSCPLHPQIPEVGTFGIMPYKTFEILTSILSLFKIPGPNCILKSIDCLHKAIFQVSLCRTFQ